jgi:hypothetical protein
VERTYEVPLAPGAYLVCHERRRCVGVRVFETGITTLHVRLLNGPTEFVLGEPDGNAPVDVAGLDIVEQDQSVLDSDAVRAE